MDMAAVTQEIGRGAYGLRGSEGTTRSQLRDVAGMNPTHKRRHEWALELSQRTLALPYPAAQDGWAGLGPWVEGLIRAGSALYDLTERTCTD